MRAQVYDRSEEVGYFAWALENSAFTQRVAESLQFMPWDTYEAREAVIDTVSGSIRNGFSAETGSAADAKSYLSRLDGPAFASALGPRYVDLTPAGHWQTLHYPEQAYAVEDIISEPEIERAAYRLMLISFLATFTPYAKQSLPMLGMLMVRGPQNRQLTISRFLAIATDGLVGRTHSALPSRAEILEWAPAIPERSELSLVDTVGEYIAASRDNGRPFAA
ncbi:hypothetical protein ACFYZ4_29445 [Streptomyces sp. NPDC001513]|uniref:hypothetical protein n=1 Tax=Streptomyces sp. NPDC001513 TaxID=3364580 RepID=UPI0036B067A2